jgi:hypothetical protein
VADVQQSGQVPLCRQLIAGDVATRADRPAHCSTTASKARPPLTAVKCGTGLTWLLCCKVQGRS